MANKPQKAIDPTEAALTAIQQALELRDDAEKKEPAAPETPAPDDSYEAALARALANDPDPLIFEPSIAPANDVAFEPPHRATADTVASLAAQETRRPANDDSRSVRDILQTMQPAVGRFPYYAAAGCSALWAVLVAISAPGLVSALTAALGSRTAMLAALTIGAFGPIALFFVLAHMVARAREMRLIARSMAEVTMRLVEPETVAHESVVNLGQAVRREVAAMGDGVERALARAAELEKLVHGEVSALEQAYTDKEIRVRDLLADLVRQRDALVSQAEQVRSSISNANLELSNDIASVSDLIAQKVDTVTRDIIRTMLEKGEHFSLALNRSGETMIAALNDRGGNFLERLEHSSVETSRAISTATERLAASLDYQHIARDFDEFSGRLAHMMASRLDHVSHSFQEKSVALTDQMVQTTSELAEHIAARGEEVNSTLRATGESLLLDLSLRSGDVVSQLELTGDAISETITSRSAKVMESFTNSADALAETVGLRGDALKDMLAHRLQVFEDMFTQGGTEMTTKISQDAATLGNLITRHLGEFDRTVKVYGGELVERLGERTASVTDALRGSIDTFDQRVTAATGSVTGALEERLARFQDTIDNRAHAINETLGSRIVEIAKTLSDGGKHVVASLDSRVGELAGVIDQRGAQLGAKIDGIDKALGARAMEVASALDTRIGRFEELLLTRAETVTTQIETRTRAAAEALHSRTEELSEAIRLHSGEAERSLSELAGTTTEAIRRGAQDAEQALNHLSTDVTSNLKRSAAEVEQSLVGVSSEVARSFIGKANEIHSAVSERAAEMTRVLDTDSSSLLAALTRKSQEFTIAVTKATQEAATEIEAKGFHFTQTMVDNSGEIARRINTASEEATRRVNDSLKTLQEGAKLAVDHSQKTAAAAVSEMMQTHNQLRTDTSSIFERLREANVLLQDVLNNTRENMSAIETTLSGRLVEFSSVMQDAIERSGAATDRVNENIRDFQAVTLRALHDLGELATGFESHGRTLVEAVGVIDESNARTSETVADRANMLESLVSTLDTKSEDLDQRLKRFSGLLEDSLESATGRAREIGRLIAETSSEGSRALSEQMESVREGAEAERRRTADTLQQVHQQSMGDIDNLFRHSTERFSEVLEAVREMTAQMQAELDNTRAQLRRGVLELPEETAESTAQLRRIIVDQIEALAELNRIVGRHGGNIESLDARRAQREEASLALVQGGRFEAARPMRSEMPVRRAEGAGRPSPMPRRAEAPALSPAAQTNGRSGWLSDLLHRASRDESEPAQRPGDDRAPRHNIESLDALAGDITRMIDSDAISDLWDRYDRGEQNAFSKRLYTPQGQRAFDEIRARYRGEREFKQTVDRYIEEFEKLLEDVSKDDRGQAVLRSYLTSETGKVYTMLAHASGRFE